MSSNKRIINLTRGYTLKYKQACKAIEECAAIWVDYGVSIRDLNLQESISRRNQQAKDREPLADAEIPGLKYEPCIHAVSNHRESLYLAYEANMLVAMGV